MPIIRSWALTRGFALHPGTRNRYEIRYTRTQHRPAPRQANDHGRVSGTHGHQSVNLGTLPFTGADGTQHDHAAVTVNGAPSVVLPDSDGDEVIVPLRRQQIRWKNNRSRHVAYGHYAMPDTPPVPTHLRGASTVIRLNSLDNEAGSSTRRTRALRAIPEGDADFDRLYGIREDVESAFADLKNGATRLRGSRNHDFQIVVYQMLNIVKALAARRNRGERAA